MGPFRSHIEVTDDEFLRAWTEFGGSEETGRLHLGIAKVLGSAVAIGGKMYKPKREPDGIADPTTGD